MLKGTKQVCTLYNRLDYVNYRLCQKCYRSTVGATISDDSKSDLSYENAKPFSEIPGPKGLPFFGTLFQYKYGRFSIPKFHHALLERYHEYGPIYKETIAGHTIVHLFDPELTKTVIAQEGKIPYISPLLETVQMYRQVKDMSPGLGNTNGEEWYRLRTNVNQMMMRPKAVTMFLPGVNDVVGDFVKRIYSLLEANPSGDVPNLRNEILLWNLESSAMTCFETRLDGIGSADDSFPQKMVDANSNIMTLSLKLRFNIPWYKVMPQLSPTWKALVQYEDFFFGNAQKLVDETVSHIKSASEAGRLGEGEYGFMMYLLGREHLSYKDISIITMSLFSDGLSTTSPTMLGQMYCLASNPHKQQKLYEEICKVAPDRDAPITADMVNRASYLKACIKEGFRFFPIGTEVSRLPQWNMVIGGYQVPKGTHVELNHNMLLREPDYFSDPNSYIPERWVRGQSEEMQNVHPHLMTPFGHGARTCAGRRFAEQEMNVMIMKLLQHFKLEWPHSKPMTQRYNVLLTPDGPESIRFVARK